MSIDKMQVLSTCDMQIETLAKRLASENIRGRLKLDDIRKWIHYTIPFGDRKEAMDCVKHEIKRQTKVREARSRRVNAEDTVWPQRYPSVWFDSSVNEAFQWDVIGVPSIKKGYNTKNVLRGQMSSFRKEALLDRLFLFAFASLVGGGISAAVLFAERYGLTPGARMTPFRITRRGAHLFCAVRYRTVTGILRRTEGCIYSAKIGKNSSVNWAIEVPSSAVWSRLINYKQQIIGEI